MKHNVLFNRPTILGHELRQGCESFAQAACSALGLPQVEVRWSDGISTASISASGVMTLSNVTDDAKITRAVLLRYAGFITHELLHRKYTNWYSTHDASDSYLRGLHNAVEDAWIEHTAIDAGLLGNIGEVLTVLVDQIVAEALVAVTDWADPPQYPFALAIYLRRHAATKVPLAAGLDPIFAEAATRLTGCKSTDDTFKLAKWVYDQLKKLPKQSDPGQSDPGQPDPGSEPGADGNPQDPPQNPSNGPESDDQGQGKGEGAPKAGNASAPAPHTEPMEVEPTCAAPEGAGSAGTWDRSNHLREDGYHVGGKDRWSTACTVPAKLRYEVRRIFEDTSTTMISPNRKAGAINVRALHRYGQSEALFQLRRDIDGVDSAVVILLDVSQSMFDDNLMGDAVATAAALVETLGAAGVKTCIMTFGSGVSTMAGFDTVTARKKAMLARIGSGGSTNDFSALRYAHELLRVRPESRKVCFVLTDGAGNRTATKQQADAGRRLGITTIGVGIGFHVTRIYGQAVKVNNVADLGQTSFKQIKLAA